MLRRLWLALGICAFWVLWPLIYLYAPHTRRTRVLVCAEGRVLLVKGWFSNGHWGLPGGGLHHGEQVQQGAARELLEETGIVVEPGDITVLSQEHLRNTGIPMHYVFCMVDITTVAAVRRQALEITETQWCAKADIAALAVQPPVSRALQLMAARR